MTTALRALSALSLTGTLAATIVAQDPTFTSFTYATGGLQPRAVALGDMNGDGALDMVAVNEGTSTVSVLIPPMATQFAVGGAPYAVALGDLNLDGKLDIVTANRGSGTVTVLMGTGTGSVTAVVDYPAGPQPDSIALGDLDKDGNMDIVVANSAGDTYSILHGLGSGTFGSTTTYALNGSGYNARAIALTDMDGDGFLDIVVASTMISGGSGSNDRVSVEINQGTGAHFSHVAYAVAYDPRGLAIGDVNGDGMPDVVTANMSGAVTVLLGIGAGNLGLPTYHPASLGAYGVAIGDLNGDGLLDIVATTSSYGATKYNSIEYLLNTGGGTFALSNPITVGSEPVGIALADIDRSGRLDIFTANRSSNDITMLVNIMPPTVGVSQYGTGTSGCAGELGLDANSVPSIGNANFAIIGASAPHSTLGVMLVSDVKDFNGSDLFGINILLHVGLSPSFNGVNAYSGPSGEQFAPMPVPAMPALIGKTFYFQTAWVEPIGLRCTPGTSGLESSRGLSVTIQP